MSERYWKERDGEEFFDDYIDVTDEVTALHAEVERLQKQIERLQPVVDACVGRIDNPGDSWWLDQIDERTSAYREASNEQR